MQIDWVTVSAQIINFLVLVYLLKRFLYAPIVNAMDKRQQGIAASLEDAAHKADAALFEAERYRHMMAELEGTKEALLLQAKGEADTHRQQLLQQARDEIADTRSKWLAEIERDKANYSKTVGQAIARQVCSISRHVLVDLANAELEAQMIRAFVRKIQALGPDDKAQLLKVGRDAGVEINSAFPIAAAQQAALRQVLQPLLGEGAVITFNTVSDALCGLELRAQGFKIVWSVDAYLNGIEERLLQALPGGVER